MLIENSSAGIMTNKGFPHSIKVSSTHMQLYRIIVRM